MIKEYIGGRSCAILGLGVSNLPLAEYLSENGIKLSVYDKRTPSVLGERAADLADGGVKFYERDGRFDGIDGEVIFRSPGIRPDRISAVQPNAELTSEVELFLKLTRARTFGITGSDGKTTTTTLTGMLAEAYCQARGEGRVFVGGNIGKPLLCECPQMTEKDIAVLELSSFQLMTLKDAPECVAVTNISPNHLDWHTGMEEYIAAKKNIVGERTKRLVTNADCAETVKLARKFAERDGLEIFLFSSEKSTYAEIFGGIKPRGGGTALYVSDGYIVADGGTSARRLLKVADIRLPGRHNVENYMTAIGLTLDTVPVEAYSRLARSFGGVEHRLELVRELNGVRYYNSSIDSSPTRTAAALSALADESIVLICGGYDKKIPYTPLAEAICRHGGIRAVSLTGATGEKIGREIERYRQKTGLGEKIILCYHGDFDEAAAYACEIAGKGDCVLLSPASASFDSFKNFAERGNHFKQLINGL